MPKSSAELLLELLYGPLKSIGDTIITKLLVPLVSQPGGDVSRGAVSADACMCRRLGARVPNFESMKAPQPVFFCRFGLSKPAREPVTCSITKITAPASIPIDSSTKIGCKLTECLTLLGELVWLGLVPREKTG